MTLQESYHRWYILYTLAIETKNISRASKLHRLANKAYTLYSRKRGF
jgi:hypothetical protein